MGEAASPGSLLLGRESELGVLDQLFDDVHSRSGSLEVTGGTGVGKSALLGEAATRAADRGMLVLHVTGVQSEARLAFAGLHHLLRPALSHLDQLASITHSPCVQCTRWWNGSARPSLTAFFSLTARRRCRACSVPTGHPSEECVPTGFLMPPAPGSATPVMTIFGVPGEGEKDDRRIDRVLSGFGS
jgi:AAA ATPase domain